MDVHGYDFRDVHKFAMTVDAVIVCANQHTSLRCIFLLNQAIHMKGLVNHLVCPMQCCLNGIVMNEASRGLAKNLKETTYALKLLIHIIKSTYQ